MLKIKQEANCVFGFEINMMAPRGFGNVDHWNYLCCSASRGDKRIIRLVRCAHSSPLACPPNVRCSPIPSQSWWLLNLFLVSFDKHPCLHRDIPLTQPLVIVYTGSRQSRRALSGFDSNIHFASEVPYRKWLDRSSLFLQLLPLSSPTVFPLSLTSFGIGVMTARLRNLQQIYISPSFLGVGPCGQKHNFWKWTILIRPSHPLLWLYVLDLVQRHQDPLSPNNTSTVIGHPMSESIK